MTGRREKEKHREKLWKARLEKAKGKEVIIKYMKIKVDNEWYRWDKINNKYEIMTKFGEKSSRQKKADTRKVKKSRERII